MMRPFYSQHEQSECGKQDEMQDRKRSEGNPGLPAPGGQNTKSVWSFQPRNAKLQGMTKLNSKQLRVSNPTDNDLKNIKRNPIYFVLDEIIDTYNIGSLFRLADAVAVEKMYLCGSMDYPPSSRVHKAAVGTEAWVPWEKTDSTLATLKKLKRDGVQIIAVEQSPLSIDYKLLNTKIKFPVAIVVGNETNGISDEVLKEADVIVELPMFGINKSFNVWGSAAIVAYKVLESL